MNEQFSPRRVLISSRCAQTICSQRFNLARTAKDAGWQVTLAGDHVAGPYVDILENEQFRFFPVPVDQRSFSAFGFGKLVLAYCRLIRGIRPSVFHAFTIKPIIAGMIAAKIMRVPVRVATVAGLGHTFLSSSPIVKSLAIGLLRIAMKYTNRVYFYNLADRDEYLRYNIVDFAKTRIVPGSGVDTIRFARQPLPLSQQLSLVFVGRLLKEKGVPELLAAMQIVRNRKLDVVLHLVGDVDSNNPSSLTRNEIEMAVSSQLVQWHGHVTDVQPFLVQAHVVILPSHREGIPLALLEGAAMGRALIAADVPGCRDVVIHQHTGLLVPPQNADAIAEAIAVMVSDRERVKTMGTNAHYDMVSRFDTAVVNDKIVADYTALALRHFRSLETFG
ncbi:MAG: glycosyltransferase family 4 protein [Sphingorhabdus sp.]